MLRRCVTSQFRKAAHRVSTEPSASPHQSATIAPQKPSPIDPFINLLGRTNESSPKYRNYRQIQKYNDELHYSYMLMCCAFTAAFTIPVLAAQVMGWVNVTDILIWSGYIRSMEEAESYTAMCGPYACLAGQFSLYLLWVEVSTRLTYPFYIHVMAPFWRRNKWLAVRKPEFFYAIDEKVTKLSGKDPKKGKGWGLL